MKPKSMQPVLRSWALRALGDCGLLSEAEIVGAAAPFSRLCGVYFLVCGTRVVYVGQAVDVMARLATHGRQKSSFDAVAVIECRREVLDSVESFYIHKLKPEWNGRRPNGEMVAPLSQAELWKNKAVPQQLVDD